MSDHVFGVSVALATPFDADGGVDRAAMAAHAKACMADGCVAVTLFGSTGEGPSLDAADKDMAFTAMRDAGLGADQVIVGVFANTVRDAQAQIRRAARSGARAVLLAPPFYFTEPGVQGVLDWFVAVLSDPATEGPDVFLYHIPVFTTVSVGSEIAHGLRERFGARIVGIKDSGGDWAATRTLLAAAGPLQILIGDERHLGPGMALGCAGAISGMANLATPRLRRVVETGVADAVVDAAVNEITQLPVIPAIKAAIARKRGAGWAQTRVPLVPVADLPGSTRLALDAL